jgi:hypothetical protein
MLTRRGFLIGAGAMVTGAFVKKATAFSRTAGEPLILPLAKRPAETLYIYQQDCEGWSYDEDDEEGGAPLYRYGKWRVSLGPNQPFAPPPPTWREHLRSKGHRLDTEEDVERILAEKSLTPEELDSPLDDFGWEDMWDNFNGPQAKAHHLLKGLDLGSPDSKLRQAGEIIFEEFGGAPGNSYTWVELKDDLTVSLLQARLIELGLPINVKVGGLLGDSA